jgi:hypothetical protein
MGFFWPDKIRLAPMNHNLLTISGQYSETISDADGV